MLVKTGKYIVFCVYRRSYLLCSLVMPRRYSTSIFLAQDYCRLQHRTQGTRLLEETLTPGPALLRRSSVLVAKEGCITTRGPMDRGTPANSTNSGSPNSQPAACKPTTGVKRGGGRGGQSKGAYTSAQDQEMGKPRNTAKR